MATQVHCIRKRTVRHSSRAADAKLQVPLSEASTSRRTKCRHRQAGTLGPIRRGQIPASRVRPRPTVSGRSRKGGLAVAPTSYASWTHVIEPGALEEEKQTDQEKRHNDNPGSTHRDTDTSPSMARMPLTPRCGCRAEEHKNAPQIRHLARN